uniref:Hyp19 n=1 Tax=Moniliophthora roreri (strain MCA 2997) TaxID=1381753 RepID=F2WVL0_MONRO|nr:hyp19 [Moniliophthora roreri]ADO51602.1 hyp19 [Moniliophthora roreri]
MFQKIIISPLIILLKSFKVRLLDKITFSIIIWSLFLTLTFFVILSLDLLHNISPKIFYNLSINNLICNLNHNSNIFINFNFTYYKVIFIISFIFTLFLDHWIMNKLPSSSFKIYYIKFRNLHYFFKIPILFLINFLFFTLLSYFNLYIPLNFFNLDNFLNFMGNSSEEVPSGNNSNIKIDASGSNTTVQLPIPKLNINIPLEAANNMVAAASSGGGAMVAYKAAQTYPGPPLGKAAVGVGVYSGIQSRNSSNR